MLWFINWLKDQAKSSDIFNFFSNIIDGLKSFEPTHDLGNQLEKASANLNQGIDALADNAKKTADPRTAKAEADMVAAIDKYAFFQEVSVKYHLTPKIIGHIKQILTDSIHAQFKQGAPAANNSNFYYAMGDDNRDIIEYLLGNRDKRIPGALMENNADLPKEQRVNLEQAKAIAELVASGSTGLPANADETMIASLPTISLIGSLQKAASILNDPKKKLQDGDITLAYDPALLTDLGQLSANAPQGPKDTTPPQKQFT